VPLAVGERRDGDARLVHHVGEVRRPSDGDRAGAESELEDEVPADDPGRQLTEGGVREGVCRPRDRDRARELGVAQSREPTGDAGEDERQGDCRPCLDPGRLAGEHEDSGADDDADTEHGQIQRTQLLAQLVGGFFGVTDRLLDRLGTPQVHPGLLAIGGKCSHIKTSSPWSLDIFGTLAQTLARCDQT
jgi:hypothetical protein